MKISRAIVSLAAGLAAAHCAPDQDPATSGTASLITNLDSAAVCDSAGISSLPRAESYSMHFARSGDGPTYVSTNGVFRFHAPFHGAPSKEVDALASYGEGLYAETGKPLNIRFTGGIANLRHSTEDFKLFLGYKLNGQDDRVEMTWSASPTTTYTAYTLEWTVPEVAGKGLEIWFEAHYLKDGAEGKAYESNGGRNYAVQVVTSAAKPLCFDRGWREALAGDALLAGDSVEIVYDVARLKDRMWGSSYAAWPAWSAYAHYVVTDAAGNQLERGKLPLFAWAFDPANGTGSTVHPSYKPLFKTPGAAAGGALSLWFEGPNRGPTVWDSDFTANYTIPLK